MKKFLVLRWILPLLLAAAAHAQQFNGKTLVKASLLANTTTIVPGQPFEVGLLLETVPHWHTYWEYPGDAGFATSIKWELPEGFAAGPIQWPIPERIIEPGEIEVYAYGEKVLLLTTIVAPKDLKSTAITLKARAAWLVCEEICIPGSAELELPLQVGSATVPQNQELFATFQKQLPSAEPPPYGLAWSAAGDKLTLTATGLNGVSKIDLLPLPVKNQEVSHPQGGTVQNGTATVSMDVRGTLQGVLVAETANGRQGWHISSTEYTTAISFPDPSASPASASSSVVPAPSLGLFWALFYGFIGGLILNLMPCVLPVISLKIFGFVKQAGDHPEKIFRHGLSFFAGILAFFLGLAALVIAFKAAGHDVTWGSQFQNPWFNLTIAVLVFAFALNLFGVFEIILPGQATNALSEASSGQGYAGSFAQGLFATLLATPCSAPFLGPALGFAFGQPAPTILATFLAVAVGMGFPYLLLSARPAWMKILPRPGAWMERVRQFMGFPLLGALLWILFIIGSQKGMEAVIWVGCFLLCVALACWIYGAFCGPHNSGRTRAISLVLILLILAGGGSYFLNGIFASSASPQRIVWQPFSQAALDQAIAEKKTVFVDFTADWCLSCKVNERLSINIPSVREAFQKGNVVPMKADWTNANPEITAALKKFGRVGVPFYVIYPGGKADQPITLPELLTPEIVLDALKKAAE